MTKLGDVILPPDILANRPAFGLEGRIFFATDTAELFRDSGAAWESIEGTAGGGITAHSALSGLTSGDDHIQYQKESEKDQNSGYAGLDAGGLVPDARIAATITRDSELATAIAGIVPGTPQGTFLVSGGQITWQTGYQYLLAAGSGYINGALVTWLAQTVTLDAADGTFDRIDVIGVDSTATVFKATGVAAANPSEPVVSPNTQLALAIVTVGAATSAPTTTLETVYTEGAGAAGEWNWTSSGSGWSFVSTTNPRTGTNCMRGTALSALATATGQRGSGSIAPNAFSQLVGYLRFTSVWANNRYLLIWLALNGVKKGNALKVLGGTFGLDAANITDYQAVIIPILQLAVPAGTLINQIIIQDVGGAISFGIDDLQFIAVSGQTQTGGGLDQAQADARYQQLSGKGVANGYASLDGSALVPDAQIPATIARDAEVTSAISTHAGLSDPHTGYVLESLVDAAGDLIVGTADNTVGRLAKGADGEFLGVVAGALDWTTPGGGAAALDDLTDVVITGLVSGEVLKYNGTNWVNDTDEVGGGGGLGDYILIEDQKTAGTSGGTFTSGAQRTRDLNTEVVDTGSHASVASNQITLAAGTYRARIRVPANLVNRHKARLQDITNTVTLIWGSNGFNNAWVETPSWIVGRFTLAGSTVLEVQHRCETSQSTFGFGVENNSILSIAYETYTQVEFWKE